MAEKNYYDILGVNRDAGKDEIKKAYRKMAMKYHPDHNQDDEAASEKFKEASEAYSVLGNDEKRKIYDQYGVSGLRGGGAGTGDFSFFSDSVFSDFEDILGNLFGFGSFFSRGGRRRGPQRGQDLAQQINLTMEEAFHGVEKTVKIEKEESCSTCSGSGSEPGSQPETCHQCGGTGQVRRSQGFFSVASPCRLCKGSGKIITHPCQACRGSGRVKVAKEIKVKFPAGVDSGNRLRVAGEGEAGLLGGPAGDLYLVINVEEHPDFERQGNDLVRRLDITFSQAVLGDEIRLDTFSGREKIKIPSESQTGTLITLRNRGFKNVNGWGRGDLIIELNVKTPTGISRKEKDLFKKLRELEKVSETA